MIQLLISEMNETSEEKLSQMREKNRKDFLIQLQAFEELVGFSIGFEDTKIVGNDGKIFFSLVGPKNEDFAENSYFQRGLKESFIKFEPTNGGKK